MPQKGSAYERQLTRSLREYYGDQLGLADVEMRISRRTRHELGVRVTRRMLRRGVELQGKSVLEVGSGWGELAFEVAGVASQTTGVEPDLERLQISGLLAETTSRRLGFLASTGEELPFGDSSFDVVFSFQVLEHVESVGRCLREMARVCRNGGKIYGCLPNYLWPIEPHYRVLYPPLIPKPFGRLYLSLRGRDPQFIDHINYLTPGSLRRLLESSNLEFEEFGFDRTRDGASLSPRGILGRLLWRLGLYPALEFVAQHKSP